MQAIISKWFWYSLSVFFFLPSFKHVFCLVVIFINILAIAFNQYVNVCFCILHVCLAHTLAFIICLLSQIFFWSLYICIFYKFYIFCLQGCTTRCSLAAGLRGNGERMRKLRGKRERLILYISSFSFYFLPLYPFPISKIVILCCKMLNTALLSQKNSTYAL